MPGRSRLEEQKAKHGERMIEVKLRFWTNNIADSERKIVPKHAWASGVVRLERNDSHGIRPGKPLPFHSLLDIGAVIEKALIAHAVQLHVPRRMHKYMDVPRPSGARRGFTKR